LPYLGQQLAYIGDDPNLAYAGSRSTRHTRVCVWLIPAFRL